MKRIYLLIPVIFFILSCQEKAAELNTLDLLEYGIPLRINAPSNATVAVDDLGVWKDITVQDSTDFGLQILASQSTTFDKSKIVADQLQLVKEGLYFSKIIEEYEDGFIFEKKIDEDNINYDFRFIKLNGDREYLFQTSLIGTFSEEAVRTMYSAVQ